MNDGKLDQYGGWTGKRFESTGYFRVEKDERWWIVTPEGNAFLSFGINHLHPEFWLQDYNATAWQKKLGLADLDSPRFTSALKDWFLTTCKNYGFNTVGVHADLSVANHGGPSVPYVMSFEVVDIPHYRNDVVDEDFLDVFSTEFEAHCDRMARENVARVAEDPYLLGYALTDCPLFTEEDLRERPDTIGGAPRESRIGWPRKLRNLGADSAGKRAYVATMRSVYSDQISVFNQTYTTNFSSFDELLDATDWRLNSDLSNGAESRDNVEFLKVTVDKYYTTALSAIRKYDSNHMFIGDKLNANTDSIDTVLPITSKYTDIVFFQMYGRYDYQATGLDRWSKVVDKPFINGDAAFTMITDTMPRPYGPVAESVTERAEWTEEYFRDAFGRPEFVGWHYCGLIDAPNLIPRKRERQHSGLLEYNGDPYEEIKRALDRCRPHMYEIALGAAKR